MVCAGLLIAAPLAIVFSGGAPQAGGTREPGGVFTGGTDDGTGGVGPGPSVATTAAQTPAPAGGDQAAGADPASGAEGAVAVNAGPAGGGGTVAQPGTAAGVPAPAPAGQQQPAAQQPAQQQPPAQQQSPVQQQPQPTQQPASPQTDPNGYPCPCRIIGGVLTSLTAPLPDLPVGPLG
jgi:hypothetical protein